MQQQMMSRVVWIALLGILCGALAVYAAEQEQAGAISSGTRVSVEYTLRLDDKTDTAAFETNVGSEPFVYVHGTQQIVPGLEKALEGMKVGESKQVTVRPEEGYGTVDQEAFVEIEKDRIPTEAQKVDTVVQGQMGDGQPVRARVAEIKDDKVILDFNHPLAGKTLYFQVKVLDIQRNTEK